MITMAEVEQWTPEQSQWREWVKRLPQPLCECGALFKPGGCTPDHCNNESSYNAPIRPPHHIATPTEKHTIRWYGLSDGERIPRNKLMNKGDWGWDATCSCGWDSRTGGALHHDVARKIDDHLVDVGKKPPLWER
jgi:hypothetical protein